MTARPSLTFLVASDEAHARGSIANALRKLGHSVIEARDGAEAWNRLTLNSRVACVVIDEDLGSGMTGSEFSLHAKAARSDLAIVLMARDGRPTRRHRADALIGKPFSRGQLVEAIDAAIGSKA